MATLEDRLIEREVLSVAMQDSSMLIDVAKILKPQDFADVAHQHIYSAMLDIDADGKEVDMLSITYRLTERGEIDKAGGYPNIASIGSHGGSYSNAITYARKIKEFSALRSIYSRLTDLNKEIVKPGASLSDVMEMCEALSQDVESREDVKTMFSAFQRLVTEINEKKKARENGREMVIRTGIKALDRIIDGFAPNDLIVVGARPGAGKTAIAMHFAKTAATKGVPVVFFAAEMSAEQLSERYFYSEEQQVSAQALRYGEVDARLEDAFRRHNQRIYELPFHICDDANMDILQIRSICKNLRRRGKCSMVIIDYLQLIVGGEGNGKTRNDAVNEVSRACKKLAKELQAPVILLSQLSRQCESRQDKRPVVSDLRDSGGIEQDADKVLLIYRPEMYGMTRRVIRNNRPEEEAIVGEGEVIVAKNRNGSLGSARFGYSPDMNRIGGVNEQQGKQTRIGEAAPY